MRLIMQFTHSVPNLCLSITDEYLSRTCEVMYCVFSCVWRNALIAWKYCTSYKCTHIFFRDHFIWFRPSLWNTALHGFFWGYALSQWETTLHCNSFSHWSWVYDHWYISEIYVNLKWYVHLSYWINVWFWVRVFNKIDFLPTRRQILSLTTVIPLYWMGIVNLIKSFSNTW